VVWIIALAVLDVVAYEVFFVMERSGTSSGDPFIDAFAAAIAEAEGANPLINNPGDLTAGDVPAANITGVYNAAGVVKIDTLSNGWAFLYAKLQKDLSGQSEVFSPSMTISQYAQEYTGGDNADSWASSVAKSLGVSTDTTLSDAQEQFSGTAQATSDNESGDEEQASEDEEEA
jgi:hypothetical protein